MPIHPEKTKRLSEKVSETLKGLIIEEGFAAGDRFYSEHELTGLLGVSRSSVREAVRILEATGWVRVIHGKGIFVAGASPQEVEAFSEWLRRNEDGILEHFEIRLIIDPKAAAYAAKNADDRDIQALRDLCETFCRSVDSKATEDLVRLDSQLHAAIAKSTKNRTLAILMKTMTRVLPEGWISSLHVPGRARKTVEEHRRIVDAIARRDPAAAEREMTEHLTRALEDIRASIRR